ncbi:MAG TPA: 50S ribosomal protein L10 [Longimicrobiales bacterium]|nr:50S ribosomal protein L10 [Longimicrobiales bacterium]
MDRGQKETFVAELRERMERAPVLYLTDFTGLDVKAMTQLRRSLRGSGSEYVVVKNRLAKRALAELDGFPDVTASLEGPTGLVFGFEDAVATAKTLSDFAKEHDRKPAFKLGVMDRQILEPAQIEKLANLPSRDQLLAELAGVMQAPLAELASALEGKVRELAGLIEALKLEREKAG